MHDRSLVRLKIDDSVSYYGDDQTDTFFSTGKTPKCQVLPAVFLFEKGTYSILRLRGKVFLASNMNLGETLPVNIAKDLQIYNQLERSSLGRRSSSANNLISIPRHPHYDILQSTDEIEALARLDKKYAPS